MPKENYDTKDECISAWYKYLRKKGKSKKEAKDQAVAICSEKFN